MLHRFLHNEEGSALLAVLTITIIITLVTGSVLAINYIQAKYIQQDLDRQRARYLAEGAIFKALNDINLKNMNEKITRKVPVFNHEARVEVKPFGGFITVISTVRIHKQQKTIRVLAGHKPGKPFSHALILGSKERNKLLVTGQTEINGTIVVGLEGVQEIAFRDGTKFTGVLNGQIIKSSRNSLPEFDDYFLEKNLETIGKSPNANEENAWVIEDDSISATLLKDKIRENRPVISNNNLTIVANENFVIPEHSTLLCKGTLILSGAFVVKPYSRIIADEALILKGGIKSEHALFFSKKLMKISDDFRGSGQFFAGTRIDIGKNSYLKYPSLLRVGETEEEIAIRVEDHSVVEGLVMKDQNSQILNPFKGRIKIDSEALVRGALYNKGYTELHGAVHGSVLTDQFYFYVSPSAYVNWLKDAVIDRSIRPAEFVVPVGFGTDSNFDILYWEEITISEKIKPEDD